MKKIFKEKLKNIKKKLKSKKTLKKLKKVEKLEDLVKWLGQVRLVYVRQYISQKKTRLFYLLKDNKQKQGFGPVVRLGQSMLSTIF